MLREALPFDIVKSSGAATTALLSLHHTASHGPYLPMATTVEANRYPRKKVAIVGSGVTGIGALWALNRSPHDVHLFEASDRLGGHTNTVEFQNGKHSTQVDTGFIVMNKATYRTSLFPSPTHASVPCSSLHRLLVWVHMLTSPL